MPVHLTLDVADDDLNVHMKIAKLSHFDNGIADVLIGKTAKARESLMTIPLLQPTTK